MAKEQTKKSISDVLENINKKYGKGTITNLSSNDKAFVKTITSGSLSIDEALGGGNAVGRIVEIFSDPSCGKSTLALHAIAETQKAGGNVAYIDTEHAMDMKYAEKIGVNIDDLLFTQPDSAEQALQILIDLLNTMEFSLIVVDSIAAMTPEKIFEADAGEQTMALLARLMSIEIPKIVSKANESECTVLFLNQTREKVGGFTGGISTPGGKAIPFYASQRIHLFKGQVASESGDAVANNSWCRVIKNKVAPPMKEANFTIRFGVGLDKMQEVVDYAVKFDIIQKSGSWYAYGDTKLGQGSSTVKNLLEDNPELLEEITLKLNENLYGVK